MDEKEVKKEKPEKENDENENTVPVLRPVMVVQPMRIPTRRIPQEEIDSGPYIVVEWEGFSLGFGGI